MIDRKDGDRDVGSERTGALARKLLEISLQRRVDGEAMQAAIRRRRDRGIGGVRRQHRHRLASVRHRLALGARDLVRRHGARGDQPIEHAVAGIARRIRGAIGPALLRRLRQGHQQGRLPERQAARLLAEIGERCRAHAFEIAAIGREAEIERQDLVLGERALDLERAHHLAQLRGEAAFASRLEQPRHLHGEGRGAGDDAALTDQLHHRPAERERVDAVMRFKALVLVGEQHGEEARIDVLARRRQPPATLERGVGPQQPPVAIHHQRGEGEPLAQRRRPERRDPPSAARQDRGSRDEQGDEAQAQPMSQPRSVSGPRHGRRDGGQNIARQADPPRSVLDIPHCLISPPSPRSRRWRCGRSGRAGTCPRRRPAAARSGRARPRAPRRRR